VDTLHHKVLDRILASGQNPAHAEEPERAGPSPEDEAAAGGWTHELPARGYV